MTLASMVLAILNVNHDWSISCAILVASCVAVVVGFVNGGLVVLLEIDSFIVTLGSGTFVARRRALDQRLATTSAARPLS